MKIWKLPTIALLDIDRIVYAVACVVEGTDEPDRNILHSAKMMLDGLIDEVKTAFPTVRKTLLYLSDEQNFRKGVRVEQEYKGNRPPKPEACDLIREYFLTKRGAMTKQFLEADDYTAMNHYASHMDRSYRTVLVDQDKDLDQIPGWRLIPMLLRGGKVVRETNVRLITHEEAIRSFYSQFLTGDKVDNIPGIPGIGPKKAAGLLDGCVSEYDHWKKVWQVYSEYYDTLDDCDIAAVLASRGALLYMRRHPADVFIPPSKAFYKGSK